MGNLSQATTTSTAKSFDKDTLDNILKTLSDSEDYGFILSAKGIVPSPDKTWLYFDLTPGEYEIGVPSTSILCQPTVAIVDEVVDKRNTRDVATEYLNFLYSDEAQKLEAENYYRPSNETVLADYETKSDSNVLTEVPADGKWIITNVDLTDIAHFGGWSKATEKHFVDGGLFDSIYEEKAE